MSLEDAIAKLTAAVEANTAALKGGKPAASTSTPAADKPKAETKAETKGPSRADVNAALNGVKDKFDAATAKTIIKDVAGVDKMADIPEGKFESVLKACNSKMNAAADDNDI